MKIAVIVGSLQKDSHNKKLAKTVEGLLPEGVTFEYVDINMPLFNQDLEADYPVEAQVAKDIIKAADGVLIVTPEYNRSIPGVLKNAIDWASRPYGKNSFAGKPTAAIGTAMGSLGTAAAQQHLRAILAYLNVVLMGQPEGYIVFKQGLVDDSHTVTDENVRKFLQMYMEKFGDWIERYGGK